MIDIFVLLFFSESKFDSCLIMPDRWTGKIIIHLFWTHRFDWLIRLMPQFHWSVTGILSVISTLSTHISVTYLGRLNYTHLEIRLLSKKRESSLTERKNLGQAFNHTVGERLKVKRLLLCNIALQGYLVLVLQKVSLNERWSCKCGILGFHVRVSASSSQIGRTVPWDTRSAVRSNCICLMALKT